jgi:hypothetical protein
MTFVVTSAAVHRSPFNDGNRMATSTAVSVSSVSVALSTNQQQLPDCE